jgi:hypothetical protein
VIPWPDALPVVERVLTALDLREDAIGLGARYLRATPAEYPAALTRLLYEECFIKALDEREPARVPGADPAGFVAALRSANAGRAHPNDGGDANYYFAYGDAPRPGAAARAYTRYYVNLDSAGAARLVASATRALNDAQVPFSLKCFRDPHDYYRRDGAVVYAGRRHDAIATALLRACTAEIASYLRDGTPLLTRRLGQGLATAPDPAGESYGQRCCRLLALAILAERSEATGAARVLETAAELERRDR